MKNNNFERVLPEGYSKAFYINAKSAKVGIIFNFIAGIVMLLIIFAAIATFITFGKMPDEFDFIAVELTLLGTMLLLFAYIVLHELCHGAAYKIMTGQKLKFGISWSCAFCGVPEIYTYRKTALVALLCPFVLFSVILIPLAVVTFFLSPFIYFSLVLVLASHLGGCVGDLYITALLLFKYRDKKMLMRDTGPEQYFYIPSAKEN